MTDEVHVTTSQADAAKLIVERNSANGKSTPEAIRKIAEAQPEPAPDQAPEPTSAQAPETTSAQAPETTSAQAPEPASGRRPSPPVRGGRRRFGSFLVRVFSGRPASGGAGRKK